MQAARGHDCRILAAGLLDAECETPLDAALDAQSIPYAWADAELPGGRIEVLDMMHNGVRASLLPTASSRAERAPNQAESTRFLALAEELLANFRPDVLLTYGGHPANLELMRRARAADIPVVFHLHNFAYNDGTAFAHASTILFPSDYSRRHYRRTVGLDGPVLPDPLRADRVVATEPEPRYVTFINPQPAKGLPVFARIAVELNQRRPDIPLLVVEGRGTSDWLARLPADLSGLTNLHRMANTPSPRDFYRVSRVVLVPSLWKESLGRVAMEALANGLPVLASERGALPETLGDAGFVFAIPERYTPANAALPTAHEVAPWIKTIERLWDDPAFEAEHRDRAQAEARRWDDDRIADEYARLFESLRLRSNA
jgi:glycosyltransferase involved in cell wall biosynthesis